MLTTSFSNISDFTKNAFAGSFLDGTPYTTECIEKKLHDYAINANRILKSIYDDIERNKRTIKFLDSINIAALKSFMINASSIISGSRSSCNLSSATIIRKISEYMLPSGIQLKTVESKYKLLKGSNAINTFLKTNSSNNMDKAVADYHLYSSNMQSVNKANDGYVLGSEKNIKRYTELLFGAAFSNSSRFKHDYSDYMKGIYFDLHNIAKYVAMKIEDAPWDQDINKDALLNISSQINKYVSDKSITDAIGARDRELSLRIAPVVDVNTLGSLKPNENSINWASEDEQREYLWFHLPELFATDNLDEWQIAAIIGNIAHESGFSPSNINNRAQGRKYNERDDYWATGGNDYKFDNYGEAFGLMQWTNDRKQALESFATERAIQKRQSKYYKDYINDMDTQLLYFYYETHGDKKIAKGRYDDFIKQSNASKEKGVLIYLYDTVEAFEEHVEGIGSHYDVRKQNALLTIMLHGSDEAKQLLLESLDNKARLEKFELEVMDRFRSAF